MHPDSGWPDWNGDLNQFHWKHLPWPDYFMSNSLCENDPLAPLSTCPSVIQSPTSQLWVYLCQRFVSVPQSILRVMVNFPTPGTTNGPVHPFYYRARLFSNSILLDCSLDSPLIFSCSKSLSVSTNPLSVDLYTLLNNFSTVHCGTVSCNHHHWVSYLILLSWFKSCFL